MNKSKVFFSKQATKKEIRRFGFNPASITYTKDLEPFTAPLDDDTRRLANETWYWKNRDFFLQNYNDKFILIDNGKVIAEYDDLIQASIDRGR